MAHKSLVLALGLGSLLLAVSTSANTIELTDELFEFCAQFPFNSRCEGIEVPVPLADRPGEDVECIPPFANTGRPSPCKLVVNDETVALYAEIGEPLSLLEDKRATRETLIPPENISAVGYQESELIIGTAEFSGSIPYFVDGPPITLSEVEVSFASELETGQINYGSSVIFLAQGAGLALKTQLDQLMNPSANPASNQVLTPSLVSVENTLTNPEQLQALEQDKVCEYCNLPGIDLTQSNFSNVNLKGANLLSADLESTNLENAVLKGVNLRGANLANATLIGADLTPDFRKRTNLQDADLENANLNRAQLGGADLSGADLREATLIEANLSTASQTRDQVARRLTYRMHTNLSRADLSSANLQQADLGNALLFESNLTAADMTDVYLESATLERANLQNANLSSARMRGASLENANLQNANLSGAELRDTSLRGANLLGADLSEADLRGANFCGATMPDGTLSGEGCE